MSGPVFGGRRVRAAVSRRILLAILIAGMWSSHARAAQQVYFTSVTNVTNLIVQRINAETVRLDISAWYLTEHAISIAILNRFQAGVPVRLIGDRGSIFEIDANTRREFYWLASHGVPIRLRYNPTWTPEINHWKMGIFVGQDTVEFGSANWTAFELAPFSSTNYNDNTTMFVDARDNDAYDRALVAAFKAKFDRIWNDTAVEPQSVGGGPPYLKHWNEACALEPMCADYRTQYPNPAPMIIDTRRLEPDADAPPEMVWGQGPEFNNRLVAEINAETSKVQFVIYRLTVDNITQALLNKWRSGVPVELIIEPNEYRNRVWPEFWLTHANLDRLWAAGLRTIKWRNPVRHAGLTHMKTLVTSAYATNASSNYASAWQRDHNYFVPAAIKPAAYSAIRNQVQAMWNSPDFQAFVPEPPDAANLASPVSGATGVAAGAPLVWNRAAFATSYDVYLGTSPSNLAFVANVPAQLVNNPPTQYAWTPPSLQGNTTYYWGVVSRTFATDADNSIYAGSTVSSFTTAGSSGGGGGPLPSPWVSQDIGAVGTPGSATYSNGTFTVKGAGANIWGTADSFRYVYQPANGNIRMSARVTSLTNTSPYAKAGVMLRESLAPNAAHVVLDILPNGWVEFMSRSSTGAETTYLGGTFHNLPVYLRLVREGNIVTGYVSADSVTWTAVGSTNLNIGSAAVGGLIVTSINPGALNTSTFDNPVVEPLPPPTGGGPLPSPWVSQDIGAVGTPGSATYSNGTFTVKGAGANIWGTADSFRYVHQPANGNIRMWARVTSLTNTSPYAKAGVMLRESLAPDAAHVVLDILPNGWVEFMSRSSTGAETTYLGGISRNLPVYLGLVREANVVTGYVSADSVTWTAVGSTNFNIGSAALGGFVVTSVNPGALNTATFDNPVVEPLPPPSPPPTTPNVVIYASDIPSGARHGSWVSASSPTSPNGIKLVTSDAGVANLNAPLASPVDYVDVPFNANAGTYRVWIRLQATGNSKSNDAVWLQFSDALVSGSPGYRINTTSGLMVNLATDASAASLNGWGWQNTAYWLSQQTAVTFNTSGAHTLRIQIREDGVQFDQIVLSPSTYFNQAPGPPTGDSTIVPKP